MRPINSFHIVQATGADAAAGEVLRFGDRLIGPVPARVVEAQFALGDGGYLVFATLDSPFEEELTILCLDPDFRERDRVAIGAPYTPGLLQAVTQTGPAQLSFRFARPDRWLLDVAPRRSWAGLGVKWLHLA
jgi:hypothetical protein